MNMDLSNTDAPVKRESPPGPNVQGRTFTISGKWIKTASVVDEEVSEWAVVPDDFRSFVSALRSSKIPADILTIPQKLGDSLPKHEGYFEYDNFAALPISTFDDWWKSLSQDTRRNVRKAAKQGVEIKVVDFSDDFARGVKAIYDETPVRQGRKFSHYRKALERVVMETSTFPDRSAFVGAYHQGVLIGFLKLIFRDQNAHIIHFLSLNSAYDLRPANALLAKAVEICADRKASYLIYRKYVYGKSGKSSLTEFKRRNGFEEIRFPRYFIPLSVKGRIALALHLHHGIKELLPEGIVASIRHFRSKLLSLVNWRTSLAKGDAA